MNIIPFDRYKRAPDELSMDMKADLIIREYASLTRNDPKKGASILREYIQRARCVNPDHAVAESLVGGPNLAWITPLFNSLGLQYSSLKKEEKVVCLQSSLEYFDSMNCHYARNHLYEIHNPHFVSDIIVNRHHLWCGYVSEAKFLEQHPKWEDVKKKVYTAKSEFLIAMSITKFKYSSLEVRTRFYSHFPGLLEKTLDGIAAIVDKFSSLNKSIPQQTAIDDLLSQYDTFLQERLIFKMKEKKWITL